MNKEQVRVAVGMSGGVDSSLAAALLKQEGYSVIGVTMKIYSGKSNKDTISANSCYGPGEKVSLDLAAEICRILDIPHHIIDLSAEFEREVIGYFRNEYLNGRTPNPCVVCNNRIKFGMLYDKAAESGIGVTHFATGHYARVIQDETSKRYLLLKAENREKDQSYFLGFLTQQQLSRTIFPLASYTKERVRDLAASLNLPVAQRPESQDFMGGNYHELFSKREIREGEIVDREGRVLGKHKGVIYYTIGQRKGLVAVGRPIYVVEIDRKKNQIVVGEREELFSEGLSAHSVNLISVPEIGGPLKCTARIRQKHTPADAVVTQISEDKIEVRFTQPQMSVTPGQTVVVYDGDVVVAAAVIEGRI